jgi:hypothetical protein
MNVGIVAKPAILSSLELLGFSPQANYTDRATAACRRCGLVVRLPGYKSRGSIPGAAKFSEN